MFDRTFRVLSSRLWPRINELDDAERQTTAFLHGMVVTCIFFVLCIAVFCWTFSIVSKR